MNMQAPFLKNPVEREAVKQVVDILSSTNWTNQQKIDFLRKQDQSLRDEQSKLMADKAQKEGKRNALSDILAWSENKKLTLEKNDCSRLHKLREASVEGRIIVSEGEVVSDKINDTDLLDREIQAFVVKHDWSMAFGAMEDGEVKLPYRSCAFEFRFSGKAVTAIAIDNENGDLCVIVFAECKGYWCVIGTHAAGMDRSIITWQEDLLVTAVVKQIRAISISLDAEVAVHHIERAPFALNEKRAKAGKPPLNDYHVVNLAKRHRIANPASGSGEKGKVRLHFRRGHWRHFEAHKTWIKWMLVGNPELGFINKHYAL